MKTRTGLAGVMGATSALALLYATPAEAHETAPGAASAYGPHVTQRALLTHLVSSPLDRLEAWATALEARASAVPDDTVLTGRSRLMAKRQLAAATRTAAFLGTVDGLTPEQQARVAAVRATLTKAAAELRALLANRPAVAVERVRVVPTSTQKVLATDRHHCDGFRDGSRFGVRSGSWGDRDRDRRWDGWGWRRG